MPHKKRGANCATSGRHRYRILLHCMTNVANIVRIFTNKAEISTELTPVMNHRPVAMTADIWKYVQVDDVGRTKKHNFDIPLLASLEKLSYFLKRTTF